MNHEFCKGKPNMLRPSTAVLYLLCVHFATRNFVINFHRFDEFSPWSSFTEFALN